MEEGKCQTRQTSVPALLRPDVTPRQPPRSLHLLIVIVQIVMAAVRLRKAFRYPEDSDEDREELDEQEQEHVIQQLQRQNDARNAQYSVHTQFLSAIYRRHFRPDD